MAAEGEFPKTDGSVLYASEVNTMFNMAPIGAVFAWLKTLTNTPALPSNWVECNGQVLSDADSVYDGVTIPDLNGDARILYGAATSGGTKTEDFMPVHLHSLSAYKEGSGTIMQASASSSNYTYYTNNTAATGTAWEGYAIVWVIRIK